MMIARLDNLTTMESSDIVPDIVDEAPSAKIDIVYLGNKEVNFGAELTPTEVKYEPKVKWDANPEKYYTLYKLDPDAPTREEPTYREINHWLVVNIKGSDVQTGEVITEYLGSLCPKGRGIHRYIFLVFEQKGKISVEKPRGSGRVNFSIRKFAKKYDLGNPIAGNYYLAQWDPYVDEWNKQRAAQGRN